MKILLGFSTKLGIVGIFKPTSGNDSLHQDSNDNGVRIINFAASKIRLTARCPHNETFISTPGPFLMGRLTTRGSYFDRHEMAFEYARCTIFQGS